MSAPTAPVRRVPRLPSPSVIDPEALGLRSDDQRNSIPTRKMTPDVYFSADVETDGPIPGPYSMLSLALVRAGSFDGCRFEVAPSASPSIYLELRPISDSFELEALRVNGLDRDRLVREGLDPRQAMTQLAEWVRVSAQGGEPVLVAYPISFDWSWLYWYFVRFSATGSPFNHSRCFDMKTAVALLTGIPIHRARRSELPSDLRSDLPHTHNALDDAAEQAEVFRKIMGKWRRA